MAVVKADSVEVTGEAEVEVEVETLIGDHHDVIRDHRRDDGPHHLAESGMSMFLAAGAVAADE